MRVWKVRKEPSDGLGPRFVRKSELHTLLVAGAHVDRAGFPRGVDTGRNQKWCVPASSTLVDQKERKKRKERKKWKKQAK